MMPVEWPLAASAADRQVDPARPRAGRDRLGVAMSDFFLDEGLRLTDEERALIAAMLRGLVWDILDELIAGLPAMLAAQAERGRDGLYRRLRAAGLMERPGLVALLLRRADEQQLSARANPNHPTVAALVSDDSAPVAEAAMALALARGRRRDRFGRLGLEFDDVPADEALCLVHLVAAAMRSGIEGTSVAIDEALAEAAERLLERHDEERRVEMHALALAKALTEARGEDDELVGALAAEGDAALLASLCAVRARIAPETAWMLLVKDGARDAMLLARLAGVARPAAAAMVAALAEPLLWGEPAEAIACFDAPAGVDVDAARRWWRLPPAYRDGLIQAGGAHG
jgi:hypothetical protein